MLSDVKELIGTKLRPYQRELIKSRLMPCILRLQLLLIRKSLRLQLSLMH